MCADRSAVARQLADMFQHGVSTAPQYRVSDDELLPALEDEEAAAELWQHLCDRVGARIFAGIYAADSLPRDVPSMNWQACPM